MGTVALLLADMERKRSQELEKSGQTRPLAGLDAIPVDKRHQHIERRLRGIEALPSLPGTISRILELLADPDVTAERLEQVLLEL